MLQVVCLSACYVASYVRVGMLYACRDVMLRVMCVSGCYGTSCVCVGLLCYNLCACRDAMLRVMFVCLAVMFLVMCMSGYVTRSVCVSACYVVVPAGRK